jgi:hypothetical protein
MYYLKCWRDARRSMLAYVGAVAFCIIMWVLPYPGHSYAARPKVEAELVLSWSYVCAWILAIAFGATGPGADIGEGLGPFLMTRPRSRAYFNWIGWAAGLSEVVVMVAVTVGMLTVAGAIRSGGVAWYHVPWASASRVTHMLDAAVITTVVTYGMTYLLTTIFKSGKRAIIGTIVITALYVVGGNWVREVSGLTLPSPTLQPGNSALLALGWLLFALACPLAAQAVLSRAEV